MAEYSPSHQTFVSGTIPGPFVILQGSNGDGMASTLDSMPLAGAWISRDVKSSGEIDEVNRGSIEMRARRQWEKTCSDRETNSFGVYHQNVRAVLAHRKKQRSSDASDVGSSSTDSNSGAADRSIDYWTKLLTLAKRHRSWYQIGGRLVVLSSLPHMSLQGVVTQPITARETDAVSTLSPGCALRAEESITLDSRTLQPIDTSSEKNYGENDENVWPPTVRLLKISSPVEGYIVSHIHNYPFVAPGLVIDYVPDYAYEIFKNDSRMEAKNQFWFWRVVYQPDGAIVRNGPELKSDQLAILPYGSIVAVKRKIINKMGLSRLEVSFPREIADETRDCCLEDGESMVSGWISLHINPLSGNDGKIVEPVNFPVPALYRVISEDGAVISSGVEISSSRIGIFPKGSVLSITGRAFTDHPRSCCIERLRLAGGRGWISSHSNSDYPNDQRIIELVGLDDSFDIDNPAEFHFEEQQKVITDLNAKEEETKIPCTRCISDINDEEPNQSQVLSEYDRHDGTKPSSTTHNYLQSLPSLFQNGAACMLSCLEHPSHHPNANKCLICLSEDRTATIIHGETGHVACCLTCARVLKARGDVCPVCRLPIDGVVQHFWA